MSSLGARALLIACAALHGGCLLPPLDVSPSCAGVPAATAPDPCVAIAPLGAVPTLDGALECGVMPSAFPTAHWESTMGAELPADVSAALTVAWTAEGLYLFVRVRKPEVIPSPTTRVECGDGVEVYVDSDGMFPNAPYSDNPGMRQLVIEAPGPVAAPVRKVGLVSTPTGPVQVVASDLRVTPARVAGGYDMEILVRASDLGLGSWPLDAGARIGLDVAINVARGDVSTGDCPPRLGQLYLHTYEEGGTCWQPWCDVRALCAPEIVATP